MISEQIPPIRRIKSDSYQIIRQNGEQIWKSAEKKVEQLDHEWLNKLKQLNDINKQLEKKSNCTLFECTYELRPNQEVDFDSDNRGDYKDTWDRAYNFDMPAVDPEVLETLVEFGKLKISEDIISENETQDPPMPGQSITIILHPPDESVKRLCFFSECLVRGCHNQISGPKGEFLVCDRHVSELDLMTEEHIAKVMIDDLNYVIKEGMNNLSTPNPTPTKTITIEVSGSTAHDDLVEVYIDLVKYRTINVC